MIFLLFCICSPILLNDILDDMVFLINSDNMSTLDYGGIVDRSQVNKCRPQRLSVIRS